MKERLLSAIKKAASEFINRESNRQSMITVTYVNFDNKGVKGEIFVSVYPEKDTKAAVEFLNRQRDEFKKYLKKHVSLRSLPRIRFMPDPVVGGSIEEVEKV